jgi:hypothetical protein
MNTWIDDGIALSIVPPRSQFGIVFHAGILERLDLDGKVVEPDLQSCARPPGAADAV